MITITIDTRESQLISLIKSRDLDKYAEHICIDVKQLEIGDVQLKYMDKTWIIERKTVQDLLASVKDGRYKEQKQRLMASTFDCTYVIEGDDIIASRNEKNQNILTGLYMHTMYRDCIRVVFTKNINDTCTFILTLCAKIIDKPDYFTETAKQVDYTDCIKLKTKKIDNITPDNCYIMQLSQIPTISAGIAKNIQKMYPKLRDLVNALEVSDDKIGLLCKIDKIGKEKAGKILQFLEFS